MSEPETPPESNDFVAEEPSASAEEAPAKEQAGQTSADAATARRAAEEEAYRAMIRPSARELIAALLIVILMGWTALKVMAAAPTGPARRPFPAQVIKLLQAEDARLRRQGAYYASHGNVQVIDELIERLDDHDLFVRRYAFKALYRVAKKDHGYDADASPTARIKPVILWRTWWARTRPQFDRPRLNIR